MSHDTNITDETIITYISDFTNKKGELLVWKTDLWGKIVLVNKEGEVCSSPKKKRLEPNTFLDVISMLMQESEKYCNLLETELMKSYNNDGDKWSPETNHLYNMLVSSQTMLEDARKNVVIAQDAEKARRLQDDKDDYEEFKKQQSARQLQNKLDNKKSHEDHQFCKEFMQRLDISTHQQMDHKQTDHAKDLQAQSDAYAKRNAQDLAADYAFAKDVQAQSDAYAQREMRELQSRADAERKRETQALQSHADAERKREIRELQSHADHELAKNMQEEINKEDTRASGELNREILSSRQVIENLTKAVERERHRDAKE